ncbi:NlpC/P60 family protein, partial [uncultured Dubosiella sp.]
APVEPAPAPVEPSAPVVDSSKGQAIANAALAQVGMTQDCTRLASNALAAVGISFHGWPEDYAVLGSWTSDPQPGDLIIYSGHIAVYIGNGQAVHGGWLGSQTVVAGIDCERALIGFIRVA